MGCTIKLYLKHVDLDHLTPPQAQPDSTTFTYWTLIKRALMKNYLSYKWADLVFYCHKGIIRRETLLIKHKTNHIGK